MAVKKAKGKKNVPLAPTYLGRFSNNLSAGIVGLANVGKSTFFQAITNSTLGNPANYPFATIDPEVSKVGVPSKTLDHLTNLYKSAKKLNALLTIYDIAGLTRGASRGEGLGNQFLNDIRQVDGIFQLVRAFENDEIIHIEGNVDPVRDLEIIFDELLLKDMEFAEGIIEKLTKKKKFDSIKQNDPHALTTELNIIEKALKLMEENKRIASFEWSGEEISILNKHNFLTSKPIVYLLNVTQNDYINQTNKFLPDIKKWIKENSPSEYKKESVVLFSASLETKLNELDEDERKSYEDKIGAGSSFPIIVNKMRESLHLISFYTCGPIEARQWMIREGSTAPQAAGVIHSTLEDTFISADVIKYDDLKPLKTFDEAKFKSTGKVRKTGKTYNVEDGDIILFKAAGAKAR